MSRFFYFFAFAIGLAVVAWIGQRFLGSDLLALTVTAIIAVVYALGFVELAGFRRTTRQLAERLDDVPQNREQLEGWLSGLPEQVQFAVQKRIDGHFAALPSPQLTPYLVGLLVMLGLLGTFAGMIVTLSGAASALDGSTDLSVIRGALAAPIAGLSLAFGTSIAGVAASAMLGLASTLSRRDRLQISRQLDKTLRQRLYHLSADYQRQQAFAALESQAAALPQMATAMESMTARMEQLGQQLEQSLTRNQQEFHSTVGNHYQALADSVAKSLENALESSSRLSAERIEPIVTEAMTSLQSSAGQLHENWSSTTRQQLEELAESFQETTRDAGENWQQNLLAQQRASADHNKALQETSQQAQQRLLEQVQQATEQTAQLWQAGVEQQQQTAEALMTNLQSSLQEYQSSLREESEKLTTNQQQGLDALINRISEQLTKLRDQEAVRGEAANDRLAQLEAAVAKHLNELGSGLEAPMTRLIETASETPKAAAQVISRLQGEMARNSERENELLEERQRLVQELDSLLESQRSNADSQRQAVDSLISGAGDTLTGISERFNTLIQEQSQQLGKLGEDITGSSQEVGALSESFLAAVELFSSSNTQLQESLTNIQKALDSAGSRHDEQLAYYVAQAREVIDLSVSSQKDVIDAAAALISSRDETAGAS
ncbi:DUF802 domain-containing protein [Marinobacter sp. 1_MG-2023]|uniref:DUF802 domain-containing protein n=1 Tax=Marinobacter sp. 1_MG-2023 TaxID=3062627 RepID=UPI0026E44757|nr:DUF802 domain-containing protein [Marinobacter sp. 1_MG-2023]MDO6822878.1 DUF802 domain-containing protein [Marinobacter sp. 1_MG-2023]